MKQKMTECEHQLFAIQEQMESKQEQKKRSLQQKQEMEGIKRFFPGKFGAHHQPIPRILRNAE